jgi:hypothetical protein
MVATRTLHHLAMALKEPSPDEKTLLSKVAHLQTLIAHFTPSLTTPTSKDTPLPAADSPNPLHVLRDASLLFKAQATKIGLLLINDPFTPTAVQKVLLQCEGECLPGIMGAVELCHPQLWGHIMVKEAKLRVEAVLSAFGEVLDDIKAKTEGGQLAVNVQKTKDKALASTGQVWSACDRLIELEKLGVVGYVVKKVEEFRSMLKDAIEELKEWGEDAEEQDEGFVGSGDEGDRDSVEDMFDAANKLPSHREDLKELLAESLRRLKLVDMLFQALGKRRLKTFPYKPPPWEDEETTKVASDRVQKLDTLVALLRAIPDAVDDLANGFYELDVDEVKAVLEKICGDAKSAAGLVEQSWDGKDDEYTAWVRKWKDAMVPKEKK